MERITVDFDDSDMAAIRAEAQEKNVAPEVVVRMKVKESIRRNFEQAAEREVESLEERRAKRFAILQGSGPLWPGEQDKPKDGRHYEQELLDEW